MHKPRLKTMWRVNLGLLLILLICAVTVDMNGEYPFLSPWTSLFVTSAVFVTGIGLNGCLMVWDKTRRPVALLLLALFIWAVLPTMM